MMKNNSSKDKIQTLKNRIKELEAIVKHYEEKFLLSQKRKFGMSSEKTLYDQIDLNGNAINDKIEVPSSLDNEQPTEKPHRRKKRTRKECLPENLPTEQIVYDLSSEEKICLECGGETEAFGNDSRKELVVVPASVMVREIVSRKYVCRHCEDAPGPAVIIKAQSPHPVIPGSFASAEAVAHAIHQKFVMGVPLYRQEQEWLRKDVVLSRQTLSNWLIYASETWLTKLAEELKRRLLTQTVVHADETTFQVLKEENKTPQSKSYLWCYRTSGDTDEPIVFAEYKPNRKAKNPKEFLQTFKGYLHADGYEAYHSLPDDIIVVGCWAHVRRKWDSALKIIKAEDRTGTKELLGKRYCDAMFKIEKTLSELSPDERFAERLNVLKPIMDEFFVWIDSIRTTPKSQLGRAIGYMISQKKYLYNILLDGRLELSNNRAERTIKPFVICRKNFLFANSVRGANAAATIFSIVETAKETGIDPFEYLSYVFKTAPNLDMHNSENIEKLLPLYYKKYIVNSDPL